jgi:hypothetical protein
VGCLVGGNAGLGPVLVAVGEEVRRSAPHTLAQPHVDLAAPPSAPPPSAPLPPTPTHLASAGGARGRIERLEDFEHMAQQLQVRHGAVHSRHVPLEAQRVVPAQRAAR